MLFVMAIIGIQHKIRNLNRIAAIHKKIEERYDKVKDEFNKCLNVIKDDKLFSEKRQIEAVKVRLRWALEVIKVIDKIDVGMEEETLKAAKEVEGEDMRMTVDVEFENLRNILKKFYDIWKNIRENESRVRVIRRLKTLFNKVIKEIKKQGFGIVYSKDLRAVVLQIDEDLGTLNEQNNELKKKIKELSYLTEKEKVVVNLLARRLRRNMLRFKNSIYRYQVTSIPPKFSDDLEHFGAELTEREEAIIVGKVTPLILALDTTIEQFYVLVDKENAQIGPVREYVIHIKNVQDGKESVTEEDKRTKGIGLKRAIDGILELIEKNEPQLMKKMKDLQGDIDKAIKQLYMLENERFDVRGRAVVWEKKGTYKPRTKKEFPEPEYPPSPEIKKGTINEPGAVNTLIPPNES